MSYARPSITRLSLAPQEARPTSFDRSYTAAGGQGLVAAGPGLAQGTPGGPGLVVWGQGSPIPPPPGTIPGPPGSNPRLSTAIGSPQYRPNPSFSSPKQPQNQVQFQIQNQQLNPRLQSRTSSVHQAGNRRSVAAVAANRRISTAQNGQVVFMNHPGSGRRE